jgi:hypothetical protein
VRDARQLIGTLIWLALMAAVFAAAAWWSLVGMASGPRRPVIFTAGTGLTLAIAAFAVNAQAFRRVGRVELEGTTGLGDAESNDEGERGGSATLAMDSEGAGGQGSLLIYGGWLLALTVATLLIGLIPAMVLACTPALKLAGGIRWLTALLLIGALAGVFVLLSEVLALHLPSGVWL